jgi:hypothetical protein
MANVPSSPILVTLMMEALCYSETSVLSRATRRNIPEYDILRNESCSRIAYRSGKVKRGIVVPVLN